jgi:hypothetical protein
MSDDLNNRGGVDRKLISLKEKHEVEYWTEALGVSKDELERLVGQVGHSAEKVQEALKTQDKPAAQ